ncbi:MAG TPA: hypothetical protein VK993_10245 [Chthoniobacterales bacterium]|nr:hypothetical protein [Chthoniobacterales bacterium]
MENKINNETESSGVGVALFAVLHLLCCGLPLLLLSGVSLATLWSKWPLVAGGLAILGAVGFVWYLKRGCATCPRNEGRCFGKNMSVKTQMSERS